MQQVSQYVNTYLPVDDDGIVTICLEYTIGPTPWTLGNPLINLFSKERKMARTSIRNDWIIEHLVYLHHFIVKVLYNY